MKYIYAGYSKCGTKTMAEVFRILGFKVLDSEETLMDCHAVWNFFKSDKTPEEKRRHLQETVGEFDVCMDVPYYFIWKEMLEAFPDAKVIFWEREIDAWYISFLNQIAAGHKGFIGYNPEWLTNGMMSMCFPKFCRKMMEQRVTMWPLLTSAGYTPMVNWRGVPQQMDEVLIKRNYRQHCADVLRNCPKEKLLVLETPNCGWKVICDFVGVDVPVGVAWPHKNKKGDIIKELFQKDARMPQAMEKEFKERVARAGIMCLVGGAAGYYFHRNPEAGASVRDKIVSFVVKT